MRRALIETISRSEKRKDVLLLLKEGEMEMPIILERLNVSRNALLPQMKILEKGYVISKRKDNDAYLLTKFGELIVRDLAPLLGTLEALEDKMEYWTTHNTDFIPPELFYNIRELKDSDLIEPELCDAMELSKEATLCCLKSKKVKALVSSYHSDYPSLFTKYMDKAIEFNFITTDDVVSKFVKEDKHTWENLINHPLARVYKYKQKLDVSALVVADDCMLLRLLTDKNVFDPKYLLSYSEDSINWGEELFQHYLQRSELLSKIEQAIF